MKRIDPDSRSASIPRKHPTRRQTCVLCYLQVTRIILYVKVITVIKQVKCRQPGIKQSSVAYLG